MDAYTGTVFPVGGLDENSTEYLVDADVLINDTTYHVATGKSMETDWGDGEWIWLDEESEYDQETGVLFEQRYEFDYTITMTLMAVVPAEYDGLILTIEENGSTEYSEVDTEVKEAKPFDTEEIATTIFKNVNYEGNLLK